MKHTRKHLWSTLYAPEYATITSLSLYKQYDFDPYTPDQQAAKLERLEAGVAKHPNSHAAKLLAYLTRTR